MKDLWPEDWRLELAKVFDPAKSRLNIEVAFIGPDGQPVGEPLFLAGWQGTEMSSSQTRRFDQHQQRSAV